MKLTLSSLLAFLVSAATCLHAADQKDAPAVPVAELSQFKLGALITGPEAKLENTAGKAVLIDEWGIHCGPCLASLPDIEKLARRHKEKMVVIGAHVQNGTDDEVKAVVKKNRLSYAITKGVSGPIQVSGIPHVFVFDTAGKLLFSGHPADREFDRAVRKAVQGAGPTTASSLPAR